MGESSQTGRAYWAGQMIVCLLFGVGGIVYGSIVLGTDFEPEKGRGLMGFLIGVGFLATFYWLVKSYRRGGPVGRAVYAWAIMQQHDYSPARLRAQFGDASQVGADVLRMRVAAKARDGQLTADELHALQQLRPDVPYPGQWPVEDRPPS